MKRELINPSLGLRNGCFLLMMVVATIISWRSMDTLFGAAFHDDRYSHILLVLPVSLALLFLERGKVFSSVQYCVAGGVTYLALLGASAWLSWRPLHLSANDSLSLFMFFFVGCSIAAFVFCYGAGAVRAARFPLLFLFLMVPFPEVLLERAIWLLQWGSADATYLFLKIAHVPVERQGVLLSLPGVDIEIARECSGIRSSLMLFLLSLVLGHLFLHSGWRKVLLALAVLPITIAKNGLRVCILSVMGIYVDPSFFNGDLHRYGGIPFFALGLACLWLVVWLFQKSEKRAAKPASHGYASPSRSPAF